MVNIYEVLNKIVINQRHSLSSNLFDQSNRNNLDERDAPLYDLLKKISSLMTKVYDDHVEFLPQYVFTDNERSFSVDDITEDDYKLLKSIDLEKVPLILRALISDLLWVQKREYSASKIAAEAYWDLFNLWYTNNNTIGILDMIRRAICISTQTKYESLYMKICKWMDDFVANSAASCDGFFSLRLMEFFLKQKNYDISSFVPVLDTIIFQNDNVSKVEQAYELKTECLIKLKKTDDVVVNNISLANYYVAFAEETLHKNIKCSIQAVSFYQKAIFLYRSNKNPQKAEAAHKRLVEIQKEIPKNMTLLSLGFDITEVIENIKVNIEGLAFEECIIRIIQLVPFDTQEVIKNRVIEGYKSDPFTYLFGKNVINSYGQTIFALPPLDINNIEQNPALLELYMHQNELHNQEITGDIWIKNALYLIRNKFSIDSSMVEFLVKDNPIIPEGRERIFQSGISMFIKGEFYEAMHILVPQVENLFRTIAKEVGGLTVTLDIDGSSMEKVLSSIFTLPEMLDCYDNDILFIFKGLLNEQAGANIRNKVAHGIISESECSSGACLYFGAAVIKLLSFTSHSCYQILHDSEKLKHYEKPSADAIKIID